MRRFIVTVATVVLACAAHAQARFGVSEADYALAQLWLKSTCLAPDARPLLDRLVTRSGTMQQAFVGAMAEGPEAVDVAAVRAAPTLACPSQFLDRPERREHSAGHLDARAAVETPSPGGRQPRPLQVNAIRLAVW